MRRLILIPAIIFGFTLLLPAQKSKVIAMFQLIETEKYTEAKTAIEEAIEEERTNDWPKTWYARGLLCQTAYQKGVESNDKKKSELYPDQLYTAYNSYEKALKLDKRSGRLERQLAPHYVQLANDFQKMGEKHFRNGKYEDALKAFEQALAIKQSDILEVQTDTNLIYNTALAAYEGKDLNKAESYLGMLHNNKYSPNTTHLLYTVHLEKEDTLAAETTLSEGIVYHEENQELVLLLADLLYRTDAPERALEVLDSAAFREPGNYIYPYTRGLVLQKSELYNDAIEAYEKALLLAPDEFKIYANIGTCYYNMGVEIDVNARNITNNYAFRQEKVKATEAFEYAVHWLEQAYEKDPDDQKVITKLYQLYKLLHITDKVRDMEAKME